MVSLQQVQTGLGLYVDNEILPALSGLQKWAVGGSAGILISKLDGIVGDLKQQPLFKAMQVVDESGQVDIDTLYQHISKQAQTAPVTVQIPLIGNITFSSSDVDKLYHYIAG